MQKATLYAALSVFAGSTLLLGPYGAVHTLWNLGAAFSNRGQRDRLNTQAAIQQRVETCEANAELYGSFVSPGPRPAANPRTGASSSGAAPAAAAAPSGGFMAEEYKNAAEEIRHRIEQEQTLFTLKFTLIGGILAVLFSLFKSEDKDFFEKLVQKRRAAAFFAAGLVTAVIVDTRLRFNAKIIESLGNWVWCMERTLVTSVATDKLVPWEGFLYFQLDKGANPLMRYSSHLLTSLLYGVAVYLFIVMPRTINRSTRAMLTHCGAVFFVILTCISLSYDCPYGRAWALIGSIATVAIAGAGLAFLSEAYRERFATSNACRLTEHIIEDAERRAFDGDEQSAEHARSLRDRYEAAARLLEPALFTIRMLERDPAEMEQRLRRMGISRVRWKSVADMARKWQAAVRRGTVFAKAKSKGKLRGKGLVSRLWLVLQGRCVRFTIQARYLEWRIGRSLRPANVEAAHAAEESLWGVYFHDFVERHAIVPRTEAALLPRRAPHKQPGTRTAGDESPDAPPRGRSRNRRW